MGDSKTSWGTPVDQFFRTERGGEARVAGGAYDKNAGFPDEWGATPLVYQHFLAVVRQWKQVFSTVVGDGQLRVFGSVQPRLVMVIVCTHLRTWLERGLDHGRPTAPPAEPVQAEGGGESV